MNKLSLVALAISLATLSGCNGSDQSLEVTPKISADASETSTALRNMSVDSGNEISSPDSVDSPASEGAINLIDGDHGSKFLSFSTNATIIIKASKAYPVKGYSLVSGNDAPKRDPQSWTLSASNDGEAWTELDSHSGQSFTGRGTINTYPLSENVAEYQYYRFSFSNEGAADIFQLAEVELMVKADKPLVAFASNKVKATVSEEVQFWDQSLANPKTWAWEFENGEPATSTVKNPLVTFTSIGPKTITLTAGNDKGSNTLAKESTIWVWDPANPWSGFPKPAVSFDKKDASHAGQVALDRAIPNLTEKIHEISLGVSKILYNDVTEIALFKSVLFETGHYDFPAAKSGTATAMILQMDLDHIANIAEQGDQALRDEVFGMLWHELTHGYSSSPNTGQYAAGDEYHTFLESVADFVRIKAGYNEHKRPAIKWVESWNDDAYNQTSFFLEWVQDSHRSIEFIKLFNKAANDLEVWSFDAAFKKVLGEDKGIATLWKSYQVDYLQKTLGIEPPYPTPVKGYSNFAIDDGVVISSNATTVEIPAWGAFEGTDKLIDNNVNKKFNAFIQAPWWVEEHAPELWPINEVENVVVTIEVPVAQTLSKYSVTTGNDNPLRDPSQWTLLGSSDGETWVELDQDQYPADPERLVTYHYDIKNNSNAYAFYQFAFEHTTQGEGIGGDDGRLVQIGELALLSKN
jgi:PKD repeat protein